MSYESIVPTSELLHYGSQVLLHSQLFLLSTVHTSLFIVPIHSSISQFVFLTSHCTLYFLLLTARLITPTSLIILHMLVVLTSHFTVNSYFIVHASHLVVLTSHFTVNSYVIVHTSHLVVLTSHFTVNSYFIVHASHPVVLTSHYILFNSYFAFYTLHAHNSYFSLHAL